MEIFIGIGIALGSIVLVIFFRSLTTLFHELGHGLPALWFTEGAVQVFVGTYGDLSNCYQLKIGRLELYLRWNPFDWKLGMCRHAGGARFWQLLLIILGGPIASTLLALGVLLLFLQYDWNMAWIGLLGIFAAAAIIDLAVNLYPSAQAIEMYDGQVTYSDGMQLRLLLQEWNLPESYFLAQAAHTEGDYEKSLDFCEELIVNDEHQPAIYQLAFSNFVALKQYPEVLELYRGYQQRYRLQYLDYARIAKAYQQQNKFEEALQYYNHCLFHNYTDTTSLFERARVYIEQVRYEEALQDLTTVLQLRPTQFTALSLRALCLLKTNDLDAALADLQLAQTLDKDQQDANIPYHLGLYYERKYDWQQALTAFQAAKDLGVSYHGIDYKINEMEHEIARRG